MCLEKIRQEHAELLEMYNYTHEGVPQGSCLSPLFGNIYLYELDIAMNSEKNVKFFRYIDDVVILGASYAEVKKAFDKKFVPMLRELGLDVYISTEPDTKFSQGQITKKKGFDYLGVNISEDVIKPTEKSFNKIKTGISLLLNDALNFDAIKEKTLYEVLDIISKKLKGWGNHYWFCNAEREIKMLDKNISEKISDFIQRYNARLLGLKDKDKIRKQLGIQYVQNCNNGKIAIMHKLKAEKTKTLNYVKNINKEVVDSDDVMPF